MCVKEVPVFKLLKPHVNLVEIIFLEAGKIGCKINITDLFLNI